MRSNESDFNTPERSTKRPGAKMWAKKTRLIRCIIRDQKQLCKSTVKVLSTVHY